MLTEVKKGRCHYFLDERYRFRGEYRSYGLDGKLESHAMLCDDVAHGEEKYYDRGVLTAHVYSVNDVIVHDFLANPLTDEGRLLLMLKYGGKFLPVEPVENSL